MLELPDLELLRRFISAEASGRRIDTIRVSDRFVLNGLSPRALHARLAGTRLQPAWRQGSIIGIPTDGAWSLILHLSPGAEVVLGTGPGGRHDRLELELERGVLLRYRGGRLKGSVGIAKREERPVEADLGPDALTISAAEFDEIAEDRRGQLRNSLVDQTFISGLGDVMADEVLFQAHLHPQRTWRSLSPEERRSLWQGIWKTLRDALAVGTDYSRKPQWIASDRRAGRACPRCGNPLQQIPARRGTAIACTHCQPLRVVTVEVAPEPEPKPAPEATTPRRAKKAAARPKPPARAKAKPAKNASDKRAKNGPAKPGKKTTPRKAKKPAPKAAPTTAAKAPARRPKPGSSAEPPRRRLRPPVSLPRATNGSAPGRAHDDTEPAVPKVRLRRHP